MDELLKKIQDLDISPEKAQEVLDTVVGFLKDKLPGGLGEKVEDLLDGKGDDVAKLVGGLGDKLGGMFGK